MEYSCIEEVHLGELVTFFILRFVRFVARYGSQMVAVIYDCWRIIVNEFNPQTFFLFFFFKWRQGITVCLSWFGTFCVDQGDLKNAVMFPPLSL